MQKALYLIRVINDNDLFFLVLILFSSKNTLTYIKLNITIKSTFYLRISQKTIIIYC